MAKTEILILRECMMPRSRSLEIFSDPATWSHDVEEIVLTKGEKGLGFSILDYQDPLNVDNSVIVVRGLVPGGAAMQVYLISDIHIMLLYILCSVGSHLA